MWVGVWFQGGGGAWTAHLGTSPTRSQPACDKLNSTCCVVLPHPIMVAALNLPAVSHDTTWCACCGNRNGAPGACAAPEGAEEEEEEAEEALEEDVEEDEEAAGAPAQPWAPDQAPPHVAVA